MRFATRIDWWMAILLGAVAIVSCVPMLLASLLAHPGPPLWLGLLPTAVWAVLVPLLLPQWYELREDGVFLRQGIRKILIPYASLVEAQPFHNWYSAGAVLSHRRVLLVTDAERRYIIAVAEEQRFIDELAKRCPHLEKRPFGLGLPLSVPSLM